jgi:hypothetical protein
MVGTGPTSIGELAIQHGENAHPLDEVVRTPRADFKGTLCKDCDHPVKTMLLLGVVAQTYQQLKKIYDAHLN